MNESNACTHTIFVPMPPFLIHRTILANSCWPYPKREGKKNIKLTFQDSQDFLKTPRQTREESCTCVLFRTFSGHFRVSTTPSESNCSTSGDPAWWATQPVFSPAILGCLHILMADWRA